MSKRAGMAISTPLGIDHLPGGHERVELITPEWHRARMRLVGPAGFSLNDILCDGWEIGEARNKVVKEALDRNIRYLFFLDSDVLPPPLALVRLTYLLENNPDIDVAAGLYVFKRYPAEPMVWTEWDNGVNWDWTWGDVVPVVGAATGAMLIRMDIFDRLPYSEAKPWFRTVRDHIGEDDHPIQRTITDDLYFCRRVCDETDRRIVVDTGVLCGHIDKRTGEVFTLPDDCLPMKRHRAKGAA